MIESDSFPLGILKDWCKENHAVFLSPDTSGDDDGNGDENDKMPCIMQLNEEQQKIVSTSSADIAERDYESLLKNHKTLTGSLR